MHFVRAATAVLIAALSALTVACTPGNQDPSPGLAESGPAGTGNSQPQVPAAADPDAPVTGQLIAATGAKCDDPVQAVGCVIGNMDSGDYYDIAWSPSCAADGEFAGVPAGATATLLDTLPVTGSNAKSNATLSSGQLLCIQATASVGGKAAYRYVVALHDRTIQACTDSSACISFGDRPVRFQNQVLTGTACAGTAQGAYTGDCARGWVEQSSIESLDAAS